jgi:hypothetical protein
MLRKIVQISSSVLVLVLLVVVGPQCTISPQPEPPDNKPTNKKIDIESSKIAIRSNQDGTVTFTGSPGAVSKGEIPIEITNATVGKTTPMTGMGTTMMASKTFQQGQSASITVNADGSFEAKVLGTNADRYFIQPRVKDQTAPVLQVTAPTTGDGEVVLAESDLNDCIEISPFDVIEFPEAEINQMVTVDVVITNHCSTPISLDELAISAEDDSPDRFNLTFLPDVEFSQPNESMTVRFQYQSPKDEYVLALVEFYFSPDDQYHVMLADAIVGNPTF